MYTQYQFDKTFERCPEEKSSLCKTPSCTCSRASAKRFLFAHLPALQLLCTYEWRKWLLWDVIAGLSVGVIHIPQGMGFALVTSVPPALGLYSSLFPVLIYFLFGTSRHISIGTMAVTSIMIGGVVNREAAKYQDVMGWNHTGNTSLSGGVESVDMSMDIEDFKVDIATSVTLLMGLFQVSSINFNSNVRCKITNACFL